MKRTLTLLLVLVIAAISTAASRAGGHVHARLAAPSVIPRFNANAGGIAITFAIGVTPPPGTFCMLPWTGLDTAGMRHDFPACNCFESVNLMIGADPGSYVYRQWPARPFDHLDRLSTWDEIESKLHVGDVVEFTAHSRGLDGSEMATPCHAHLCAQPGGLMVGANNEPRFDVLNGVPTNTHRWSLCTSREYYQALATKDTDITRPHSYTLVLYQKTTP